MNKNQIKILGTVLILIFAAVPVALGNSININTNDVNKTEIEFSAVNIDETTIEIIINPGEFEFQRVKTINGDFTEISKPGYTFSYIKGEAKLPLLRRMIEIPQEADVEFIIEKSTWTDIILSDLGLPSDIIPAQMSVEKIPEPIIDFEFNDEYYSIDDFLPKYIVRVADTGEIRSRNLALVEISPIQYNPVKGALRILQSCKITMNLQNTNMQLTYDKMNNYYSKSFEKMFEITFVNYGFYEKGIQKRDQEGYLAIVYDNFYDEFEPLANYKESKGYDVTITKTSDIPGGATKDNIYDYIEDAYNNWAIPPTYVLLVGDTPQIPTFQGTTYGPSAVDLYYVTMTQGDFLPDIFIGRFPGSQETHITAMVDKTVFYEQGGPSNTDWIKQAAFIASSDHSQLAEQTHNYCIDNFLVPNGYTCDKIYEASGGNTQDIFNALNDGRSLCIYSGHGYNGGWACVPFDQVDVGSLDNEGMYPLVCSHACSTNTFDDPECYGETWLREADKAGLAFWGASASTYWDEDDILEKGMFESWWTEGLDWIGGMTDGGLYRVYENYSGGGSTKYYYEAYNVNGDPSVRIWSDDPNLPPDTPQAPSGPNNGSEHQELTFSAVTTDPEGESIYYMFDWGNGETSSWIGPLNSGEQGQDSYIWVLAGEYEVKVKAKDINNRESGWSEPLIVIIGENEPPGKPDMSASFIGTTGKTFKLSISAEDPDAHDVSFFLSWGDGVIDYWLGPYASGEVVEFNHTYTIGGKMNIVAKAKDQHGVDGPQNQISVIIIKDRAYSNEYIFNIFQRIINKFPILIQLF
jgi:hypothetical protein